MLRAPTIMVVPLDSSVSPGVRTRGPLSTGAPGCRRAGRPEPFLDASAPTLTQLRGGGTRNAIALYSAVRQLFTTAVTASSEVAISTVNRASAMSEGPIVTVRVPTWA